MDKLYRLIDELTNKIPLPALRMIRLGALLVWLILGTVAVFFAWQHGSLSVPSSGQDLSMTEIKERVQRENNQKNPPPPELTLEDTLTIPNIDELKDDYRPSIPYPVKPRTKSPLSGVDTTPLERPTFRPPTEGPAYQGEKQEDMERVYEQREYVPPKDSGAGGVREQQGLYPRGRSLPESDVDEPKLLPP